MSGFAHLHAHTTWSLLDGAIPAEDLPNLAAELGYETVAMTDHDALTGAVRFTRACEQSGVKPLYGAELTLRLQKERGRPHPQGERGRARPERTLKNALGERSGGPVRSGAGHVTVIAKDATGYGNLCRLISQAHLGNERGEPSVTFSDVVERSEGLFVLSGCERGEVARLAAAARLPEAVEVASRWRAAIGDGYRLEVFDHRGYGDRTLRDRLLKVASGAGVPPVATNDVHYAAPRDAGIHELLHAIKEIVPLSKAHALRSTSEYCLKSPGEMRALFSDCPEAADETLRIAEACDFSLDLGVHHFPDLPMPTGETATGMLARRCYEGAHRRYHRITRELEDRLQHELGMIFKLGFAAYFMTVADIVAHVRHGLGIRCACRGSAAGSLVCYVLGISDVDPVRYDLLFERFMNTRREEMPDIDVDVESARREEVLDHVLATYGAEQTAICCMVDTFRARMAIRDIGKAMGMPAGEIDVVAKSFPRIAARDIPAAIERLPELSGSNLDSGQLQRLFDLCRAVDGFPRHLALHPSGVILSSPDLADRVPMQESFGGFTMLQADKDDVEELGLVKLDVLGVRMLSSIAHAVDEVARVRGEALDLDSLPHDDERAYEIVRSSNTIGCFQIESPGQRELLARFQPTCFEDLIVDISLFRPGPVKSDMVSPFLDRRHGFADTVYLHERLERILAETNGVVVFHEQVIRVIAAVTGCSLDDADYVRRHLDTKGDGAEGNTGKWFRARAVANGFTPDAAARMWKEVFSFASFGFCKSHAAAFALPTYLSAWLKAHYPAEFYAGLLTHDPGMYPRRMIVADARRNGVVILPVDVNRSGADYRVEPLDGGCAGVRLALSEVKEMSTAEIDAITAARRERPFTSLEDLWRRAAPSAPVLENLVHVGALDAIAGDRTRRELLWRALDLGGRRATGTSNKRLRKNERGRPPQEERGRARPQRTLKNALGERSGGPARSGAGAGAARSGAGSGDTSEQLALDLDEPVTASLPELPGYTALEETEAELGVTGIDARRHVMELYEPVVARLGCKKLTEARKQRNDAEVWVAGIKTSSQTPAIRSGQRIIFVTIDDTTGPIEVTVFERVQPWCARTVFHSWLLLVRGYVRKRGGATRTQTKMDPKNVGLTVVAEEAFDLAAVSDDLAGGMSVDAALARQRKVARAAVPAPDAKQVPKLWHASGGSAGR